MVDGGYSMIYSSRSSLKRLRYHRPTSSWWSMTTRLDWFQHFAQVMSWLNTGPSTRLRGCSSVGKGIRRVTQFTSSIHPIALLSRGWSQISLPMSRMKSNMINMGTFIFALALPFRATIRSRQYLRNLCRRRNWSKNWKPWWNVILTSIFGKTMFFGWVLQRQYHCKILLMEIWLWNTQEISIFKNFVTLNQRNLRLLLTLSPRN